VECGGTRVLVDAGLGPRELAERLRSAGVDPASVSAIVISHEHEDHARGAASFSRKWGVRLCGSRGTYAAGGFGAEDIAGWDVLEPGASRTFGAITVTGVPVPHDAAGPLGFVVSGEGASLGHATDFGHVSDAMVDAFASCSALLMESNYDPLMLRDGPYPYRLKERIQGPKGHVSNQDVARYLARGLSAACRTVLLAHLSRKNNHPEIALQTAERALLGKDVALEITGPEGTDWIGIAPSAMAPPPPRRVPQQMRLF
jgi:phosphoribosyl 1,2-cyclic phosphodiesterase